MKTKLSSFPVILIMILISSCSQEKPATYNNGEIYQTIIYPGDGDLYSLAEYRVWIPDGTQKINGIIVHQHGYGRNGMSIPYDIHWQALARRWNMALMGTHYVANDNCSSWSNPWNGSDKAFKSAIHDLSVQSNHPELNEAPWALWGHSGGGSWVINMLNLYPEKIIAVFARSGGGSFTPEGLKVPVVFNYGITDMRPEMYHQSYVSRRAAGGFCTMALDSTTGHNCGNSRLLSIPFFNECIANRMAKDESGNYILKETSISELWFGDPANANIYEGKTYQGDKDKMTWLISENFAKAWQEFVRTGSVTDLTAPNKAPSLTEAKIVKNTIIISFRLEADLESGVKDVILYRDGKEIKKYIGPNDIFNVKHFQYANFGDEPVPESMYENVEMWIPTRLEFTDYRLEVGKTYDYSVKFTNWSDLESPMSEVLTVKIPQ